MGTDKLVEIAQEHAAVDFASPDSMRGGNAAAAELRAAILSALSTPSGTDKIIELLSNAAIAPWIAYSALEHGELTEFQRARCLSVIRSLAVGDGVDAVGAKTWLAEHGCEA
ncbi:hypothetical protein [Luteimonas vadosa]|uniref:Uncharacterized protein n=1 Tax=Luteimonas vadosa TaxID=1165507 RepID=A0ABP9EAL5_9GAMM